MAPPLFSGSITGRRVHGCAVNDCCRKFLIFLGHFSQAAQAGEDPHLQRSHTLWPLSHTIHIGGRKYFLHLMHLNLSVNVSGTMRLAVSTFGLEASDIMNPHPQVMNGQSLISDNFACQFSSFLILFTSLHWFCL